MQKKKCGNFKFEMSTFELIKTSARIKVVARVINSIFFYSFHLKFVNVIPPRRRS